MRAIFFVFALLFANLYVCANTEQPVFLLLQKNNDADASFCFDLRRGLERPVLHSENINFADADYCINWMDEENKFDTRLVFVKKNDDSKIQPDTLYSMECIGRYSMSIYYIFYFIDESGQNLFSFGSLLPTLYVAAARELRIRSSRDFITEMNDRLLSPVIQVDFPNTTGYLETAPSTFKKEDLLQFEGKIVDAHIDYSIKCPPDLDATHRINFRVKITGLCEPDFLNNSGLEDR